MTNLTELELIEEDEEDSNMGSWNHAFVQSRLNKLLPDDDKFTPVIELTLDISRLDLSKLNLTAKEELKPDVCLYPAIRSCLSKPLDILKMSEMPLLAIEILSPKQGMYNILAKFQAYFTLGVKSCWLVAPDNESITVYSSLENFKIFDVRRDTEVADQILDIHLPLQPIFRKDI